MKKEKLIGGQESGELCSRVTDWERAESESYQILKGLLQAFTAKSPIGIYLLQDGKIQFANPQYQELSGYGEDELIGVNHLNCVFPEDINLVKENAAKVLKGRPYSQYEYRFVNKNGNIKWVMETLTSFQYKRRRAVLGYFIDVTERKQVEEGLCLSEEKWSKVFRSSPDPISIATLEEGRIIDVSDAYVLISGYRREEFIGHTAVELGFWSKVEDRNEMVMMLKERGAVHNIEINLPVKSGEKRFGLLSAETINLAGTQCLLSIVKDITDRKYMEQALRDSEEFGSNLLNNSPNPIVVVNSDTSIRYVNAALERLTGFSRSELTGRKAPYPWWIEGTLDKSNSHLRVAIREGERNLEQLFQKKNGERLWVKTTTVPVKSDAGPKYYVSNWVDVTEERRLRENLQFYIAEITKAQEEERRRVARELHDETIQQLTDLYTDVDKLIMMNEQSSEANVQQLEALRLKIDNIADGVRHFSEELRPGCLDQLGLVPSLELLVEQVKKDRKIKCRMELISPKQNISPEAEVALFRITQEALRNVVRHSEATEVVASLEYDKEKVKLNIIDNGNGFELRKPLSSLARKGKLGLIGMNERARLVEGSFCVKSQPGQGTRVVVEIPYESTY